MAVSPSALRPALQPGVLVWGGALISGSQRRLEDTAVGACTLGAAWTPTGAWQDGAGQENSGPQGGRTEPGPWRVQGGAQKGGGCLWGGLSRTSVEQGLAPPAVPEPPLLGSRQPRPLPRPFPRSVKVMSTGRAAGDGEGD